LVLKGIYKLSYTLDKELKDLIVTVELRMIEGFNQPGRNVWEGHVVVNDRQYEEDLSHCVNALIACERIGHKLRDELKAKAKAEGHSLRIKKETTK
jgi:hypothetical protein